MNGIEEEYVSFETAKLLREKGFDDVCRAFIAAPSQSVVMRWLREVHNINIEIFTYWTKDKSMVYGNRIVRNNAILKEIDTAYNSYEEACENSIKYCLENLI